LQEYIFQIGKDWNRMMEMFAGVYLPSR